MTLPDRMISLSADSKENYGPSPSHYIHWVAMHSKPSLSNVSLFSVGISDETTVRHGSTQKWSPRKCCQTTELVYIYSKLSSGIMLQSLSLVQWFSFSVAKSENVPQIVGKHCQQQQNGDAADRCCSICPQRLCGPWCTQEKNTTELFTSDWP